MNSGAIWRRSAVLALVGGSAFWLANFAISLTPVAADYRAALSISYVPMLVEALLGGLIIGFGVGFVMVRFHDRIPTSRSISKSLVLSLVALALATLLLDAPAKFLTPGDDSPRLFLIAFAFNTVRILALGVAVGWMNDRMNNQYGMWRPRRGES